MKKTDIAMIVLIASVSVIVAYFTASALFGSGASTTEKVKTIDVINATITEPSKEIFNANAINPTQQVQITGSSTSGTTQ